MEITFGSYQLVLLAIRRVEPSRRSAPARPMAPAPVMAGRVEAARFRARVYLESHPNPWL